MDMFIKFAWYILTILDISMEELAVLFYDIIYYIISMP